MQEVSDELMNEAIHNAFVTAIQEATDTPLTPGTSVGHMDMEKYGKAWGTLLTINETESTVQLNNSEETATWDTKGMVDVDRVDALIATNLKMAVREMILEEMLYEMIGGGVGGSEELSLEEKLQRLQELVAQDGGIGGPNLPTPSCDCDHCKTFTPEEHEEARLKAVEMGIDFSDPNSPTYGKRKVEVN